MSLRDNKRLKGDKLRSSVYKGVDPMYSDESSLYDPAITKSEDVFRPRSSFKHLSASTFMKSHGDVIIAQHNKNIASSNTGTETNLPTNLENEINIKSGTAFSLPTKLGNGVNIKFGTETSLPSKLGNGVNIKSATETSLPSKLGNGVNSKLGTEKVKKVKKRVSDFNFDDIYHHDD